MTLENICEATAARVVAIPRAPLTEEQIAALVPDVQAGWTREQYCQWMARAVERAHGITAAGMGEQP